MKSISEIRIIMDKNKITQDEIAEDLGLKQQNISAWFSRNSIPKKHYKDLMDSLTRRSGIMNAIANESLFGDDKSIDNVENNNIKIKFYNNNVCAGSGFDIDSVHEMPFTEMVINRSIIPSNFLSSDICAMRVDGKSMIPTLLPDEFVLYKEEIGKYSGDALYIVNFGGMLMVKRIQFNPENGKFDIIADNKDFKSYSVDMANDQTTFIIIGKVIATIQQ